MTSGESQVSPSGVDKFLRRVANALGVAALYAGSPSVIDRMANAINMEAVLRAFYDAERIISVGLGRGDIVVSRDEEGRAVIRVGGHTVYGNLPRPEDFEMFVEAVRRDFSVARRVASRAIIIYNRAVRTGGGSVAQQGQGQGQEQQQAGGGGG